MPHLNLLRDPVASVLLLGVSMPPEQSTRRWAYTVALADESGRELSHGGWTLPRSFEHADLGHVFRATYDAWFNGDAGHVCPAAERAIRAYTR